MRHLVSTRATVLTVAGLAIGSFALDASADAVTDWNMKATDVIAEAKLGTPPAIRVIAIVQTAVHDAVSGIPAQTPQAQASMEAAVAAANRAVLVKLVPSQQQGIEAAYNASLARIDDGAAKSAGIATGERAAAAVLAARVDDGAAAPEAYRPSVVAGAYVPTSIPAVPQWPQRKPWSMTSAAQFRPVAPPALSSDAWARDYSEVKALGSKTSTRRSAEQTDIARFWDYSLPPIYYGVVRSIALMPGRDVASNARLYAATAQAMDDALIGVFDAKYHYGFWRPATAIRNGDNDGNDATERDAAWTPLIDAPMHPEYPSAHGSLAAAVGAVVKAEVGSGTMPVLTTTSPSAKGAARTWTTVEDFTREVGNARIYGGIHYRTSTDVGAAMGKQVGELTVAKFQALAQ